MSDKEVSKDELIKEILDYVAKGLGETKINCKQYYLAKIAKYCCHYSSELFYDAWLKDNFNTSNPEDLEGERP